MKRQHNLLDYSVAYFMKLSYINFYIIYLIFILFVKIQLMIKKVILIDINILIINNYKYKYLNYQLNKIKISFARAVPFIKII